ncbi:hypothetical protein PQX77_015778, partial [Marasmius sp. AFHP31]
MPSHRAMNSIFANASDFSIGDYATMQNVAGNATTNVYHNDREDTVDLYGNRFRQFSMGDIIIHRDVSSSVMNVTIESPGSVSEIPRLPGSQVLKVRKTVHHVSLLGLPGAFTSVTIEPVNEDQAEEFKTVRKCHLDGMFGFNDDGWVFMGIRSSRLTHLVGLGWSKQLILIVNEELANAQEFALRILSQGNWITYYYLKYTR